jgi:hypothetical protein
MVLPLGLAFAQPALSGTERATVLSNMSQMPLTFVENQGQWDENVLFKANAGGVTFRFCPGEVQYMFSRNTGEVLESRDPEFQDPYQPPRYKRESYQLKAQFIGANPMVAVSGSDRSGCNTNFYFGQDPSKWKTDVPGWSSITYRDLYPGIDLVYHGDGNQLKYDFVCQPGTDISQIKINYDGVNRLDVTNSGELEAIASFGPVYEKTPYIYQEIDGQKSIVSGHYEKTGATSFGFILEDGYNPNYAVIIDPVLQYAYYFGNPTYNDFAMGIAIDGSAQAYVTGYTYDDLSGNKDAYVAKINSIGDNLLYITYFSGSGAGDKDDEGDDIAINSTGQAFVTGNTYSYNFPTLSAFDGSLNTPSDPNNCTACNDAFVMRLNSVGNLLYGTFLGGYYYDYGYDIALDGSWYAYVTGQTRSSDFPMQGAYDNSYNGTGDAFVTKVSPLGNSLSYSTFLGGGPYTMECGYGIAVDISNQAYVAGYSSSDNFPTTGGAYDVTQNGGKDAFVTKFNAAGNALAYSTFIGGSGDDEANDIAINSSGQAYITGYTASTNYPTLGPYQTDQGGEDVFVTKLNSAGSGLVFSTYLGGAYNDVGRSISVDSYGDAYVSGFTLSSDFPMLNAYQGTYGGLGDIFVTKLGNAGGGLVYSTYFGAGYGDYSWDLAVDGQGRAYVSAFVADGTQYNNLVFKFGVSAMGPPPCTYIPGDADNNGTVNANDVSYMANYFRGGPPPPISCSCPPNGTLYVAGDANGSCQFNGMDVTYLAAWLNGGPSGPKPCPDCPSTP